MMAKITKGNSFARCVKYVLTKKDAQLIAANGVLVGPHHIIAECMENQAHMNPRLTKRFGHISLNFSVQDKDKIDNAFVVKVAREYMQKMGIKDTQYIIVRHNDKEHPHCHIVFNRVSNSGKTITDKNDRHRSVRACRTLTEKYELYLKKTDAKQEVKREQLRGPDKVKYEIYDAIKAALPHCRDWDALRKRLDKQGIGVTFKLKGGTEQKEGVIFTKDGHYFNGSKVDRQFSFSKLDAALNANAQRLDQSTTTTLHKQTERNFQGYTWPTENSSWESHSIGSGLGSLFDIPVSQFDYDENEAEARRLKRKKKKRGCSL